MPNNYSITDSSYRYFRQVRIILSISNITTSIRSDGVWNFKKNLWTKENWKINRLSISREMNVSAFCSLPDRMTYIDANIWEESAKKSGCLFQLGAETITFSYFILKPSQGLIVRIYQTIIIFGVFLDLVYH